MRKRTMKKMMKRVKAIVTNEALKVKGILNDTRGEGYIDTAVFPVQDNYDTMNTIQKIKYQIMSQFRQLLLI